MMAVGDGGFTFSLEFFVVSGLSSPMGSTVQDGQRPCYAFVFNSGVPQRAPPNMQPGQEPSTGELIGPSTYTPKASTGQPFLKEWIQDPAREQSAFASKTQKSAMPRSLTADLDIGKDFGARGSKVVRGSAPGSHGLGWAKGQRTPPFFHVPFRAYPLEGGEPRGRDIGLDIFYEIDTVSCSPIALNATLAVNVERSQRRYSSTFRSKQPARPNADNRGGSGELGPGSYTLHRSLRSSIKLLEPDRPSGWSIPYSGGKFRNVGESNRGWNSNEPPEPPPMSQARSWTTRIQEEEDEEQARARTPAARRPGNIHTRLYNLSKQPSAAHVGGAPKSLHATPMRRAQSAPRLKTHIQPLTPPIVPMTPPWH